MIKVRRHLSKDISHRVRWLNDPEVNRYIGDEPGTKTNLNEQKKWFIDYRRAKNKKFFTICEDTKPIGFMGLSNISKANRNADLFIAIGEDGYRGRGIGKIAMEWLIDYGFNKLNLHKINLGVIKDNKQAIILYRALGFIVEGEMKDEVFFGGRYHDFYSMALFKGR